MTKVLYIEDMMVNRRLVKKCLRMMDYEYIEAVDGLSGIATAKREIPDVIIIDINLPDINGIEVASHLRDDGSLSHVRLIALTADTTRTIEDQCLNGNFDAYLNKPVSRSRLLSVIKQLLQAHSEGVA